MADTNQPPFRPPKFVDYSKNGGKWNVYTGPWEDGASLHANDVIIVYTGMTQTGFISTASPKPPKSLFPAAAPPSMSKIP